MNIHKIIITTVLITFALASTSYALDHSANQWYQLAPITPQSLNNFVAKSTLFIDSQGPTDRKTVLYSISASTGKHYSIYTMHPEKTIGKVTEYRTTEHVANGSGFAGKGNTQELIVHGKGLSLGGIFWPKESMKAYNSIGQIIYDNHIDITAIKPISGKLFPMHVGAELKFEFKRTHSRLFEGRTTVTHEIGTMTYKVVKEIHHFSYSTKKIPGPIYEIQVWESTNLHPKPYLTDIYQYSNGFHWYISDKYFTQQNKLIAWYRVRHWA